MPGMTDEFRLLRIIQAMSQTVPGHGISADNLRILARAALAAVAADLESLRLIKISRL